MSGGIFIALIVAAFGALIFTHSTRSVAKQFERRIQSRAADLENERLALWAEANPIFHRGGDTL